MSVNPAGRRRLVAVIGDGRAPEGSASYDAARALGKLLVDRGFRVTGGGHGGVMEAAFRGAHESVAYREGDTVAVLPRLDRARANPWADIVIATELGHMRNALVASADAVVAVGGGAGTLSEMSFAWMYGRLLVALRVPGWSGELADRPMDGTRRHEGVPDDVVRGASSAEEAVDLVVHWLPAYLGEPRRSE